MNILFLSTENPFPVDHGHHIRTYHTLKALTDEHKVHFVCFTKDYSGSVYEENLQQLCESVAIFPQPYRGWRQIGLILKNLFSKEPLVAQKYYDHPVVDYIKRLITQAKIELVHIDLLHIAKYIDDLDDRPGILVNHNVESLRMRRWASIERNILLKTFLRYQYGKLRSFEQNMCPRFARCIVVSDQDKNFLKDLCGGENFVVIPNGVDADYFVVSDEGGIPNSLIWTGSMASPYNRDGVLYFLEKIWSLVQNEIPETKVTFVGGSPPKLLKKLAQKSENIRYTGYVEDVRPYVAKASVFIAPLRAGSGTKIKVLNAMAQGKPVVTTSVGAEGIDAMPGAEIMIADTPEEFAQQIIHLLKHSREADEIGLRARKLIEKKYAWTMINSKMSKIYQEFADASQPTPVLRS